jgi:hypothetical protein
MGWIRYRKLYASPAHLCVPILPKGAALAKPNEVGPTGLVVVILGIGFGIAIGIDHKVENIF